MRLTIVLSLAILFALAASVPLALAQGTYTQIDYPGAIQTYILGVNTAGDVVGGYVDSSSIFHGFLLSGGVYTTIDYPGASYTDLGGINDLGKIVGNYIDATVSAGFLYDLQTLTFTNIQFPTGEETLLDGINNAGIVAGGVDVTRQNLTGPIGFELANGIFHKVLPQGFAFSEVVTVNNLGDAVGNAAHHNGVFHPFLFQQGQFHQIDLPVPPPAAVSAINDTNTMVGSYGTGQQLTTGFVLQNGNFQSLTFPGAMFTIAAGVNNGGEVVGYFFDSGLLEHGFLWTPPAGAARK